MPTFETPTYDLQDPARANPARRLAPNIVNAQIAVAQVSYTLVATEAADDIINLCILPPGAVPIPALSSVACADPGTALVLDVGTDANDDALADGIVLSAGGVIPFAGGTLPLAVGAITPTALVADTASGTTGNTRVYATVKTATSLTADVVLTFTIAYKIGG